uniref:uncharacterized protein LOC124052199 n=1 Tax=Scatophagus argus TaxID=75038 RepID=UPI001ED82C03|nr:uncharacterized protein LOC124052199 [Scatophagus argus]XP_046232120.1 uncharacterized protein LOC124052199 [Scatophagus argus]
METELQELRDLVAQLRTDNERLRQEQVAAVPGSSIASSAPVPSTVSSTLGAPLTERLIFVPRDRKCPIFRGKSGIGLTEWLEEVQACMRARHLSVPDQAFFLFDHLEGEAREEIKYRPSEERSDPGKIIAVLQELYGCAESYVALQEAFFSRRQQEGETLLEFSLALMGLMTSVKQHAPGGIPNAEVLLRDQFVEHVLDGSLRRELKQLVRRQPTATLLDARSEAIRWEREGLPGGVRGRSHSVPSVFGAQCVVQGSCQVGLSSSQASELHEVREMLKLQQEQLNQLTQCISRLSGSQQHSRTASRGPIICRRCQQPGHIARECTGAQVSTCIPPPLPDTQQHSRKAFHGPIICRRCQQPGHIARECGGVRVSTCTQSSLPAPPQDRPFNSARVPEN